jgi:hypothetical protein
MHTNTMSGSIGVNWEAIGAISEVIGAAGVIASMLYLAVQVRSSTRASAIESKLASSRVYTDFLGSLIQSPELNRIFLQGRKDLASLTSEDDYHRFSNLALQGFSHFSATYFQYQRRMLSDLDWFESRAVIQYWVRGAGFQAWWTKLGRKMFGADFVAFIDSEIREQTKKGEAFL